MTRQHPPGGIFGHTVGALAVLALLPLGMDAPSAASAHVLTSSLQPVGTRLEAATATLDGLVLEPAAPAAPGDPQSLKLTSTSATLAGLGLHVPCQVVDGSPAGISTDATTPAGATSTASQGITLYATSITALTPAGEQQWTPATVLDRLELGNVTLPDVTVELAPLTGPSLVALSLSVAGLNLATSFCGP